MGFFISFDPRGDGDCFYTAVAHQLSLEREQVKKLVFQHLENHMSNASFLGVLKSSQTRSTLTSGQEPNEQTRQPCERQDRRLHLW